MTAHPVIIRTHRLWAGEGCRARRGKAGREGGGGEEMYSNCEQIISSHISRKLYYKSVRRGLAKVCQQDPDSSPKFPPLETFLWCFLGADFLFLPARHDVACVNFDISLRVCRQRGVKLKEMMFVSVTTLKSAVCAHNQNEPTADSPFLLNRERAYCMSDALTFSSAEGKWLILLRACLRNSWMRFPAQWRDSTVTPAVVLSCHFVEPYCTCYPALASPAKLLSFC